MEGTRHSVVGADGVRIGLLTAGAGPPLLLVHGGFGRIERWERVWAALTRRWQVTAMDRRGRGSSGDGEDYAIVKEYEDVAAVGAALAPGSLIDVVGHSYGATCTLGAAAHGAPFRRVVLYEPPGSQTGTREWVDRVTALISDGKPGRAMYSFLTEVMGVTAEEFDRLTATPGSFDILSVVSATMPREARALLGVDLLDLAADVDVPVLLMSGTTSPPWAGDNTRSLAAALPDAEIVILTGQGHEALESAPGLVVSELERFFLVDPQ